MATTQQKALTKIFGDPQKRILKRLQKKVDQIKKLREEVAYRISLLAEGLYLR